MVTANALSRRKLLQWSSLALAGAAVSACQPISPQSAPVPEADVTNPDDALARLIALIGGSMPIFSPIKRVTPINRRRDARCWLAGNILLPRSLAV